MGGVSNPVPGPTFIELAGGEDHDPGVAATWEDWDISGIVPVGTQYVLVVSVGGSGTKGTRENGSALARNDSGLLYGCWITKVDTLRVIEVYADLAATGKFCIWGYWL